MWPTILCGFESVAEHKKAELQVLRFSLGMTQLDKIRHGYGGSAVHVRCFGDKARDPRLRWFGHVLRRDIGCIERCWA